LRGAEYVVSVVDSEGKVVAQSSRLRTNRWVCSSELLRGNVYRWQVRADREQESTILPAPPAPPALFRVIESGQRAEIEDAERQRPDDHLLLGLLYARAGVVEEARKHLERYRVDDGPMIRRLIAQLPPTR
jgi:hypothetical protein